jgi:hypothetical protein
MVIIASLLLAGAALICTGVAMADNHVARLRHAALVMATGAALIIGATMFTPAGELKRPMVLDHQDQQHPDWRP